ncbi:MAG: protein kinase [Anaerolineales bacterium]|nr:protein kinase [Anaerolineales bacterium]
MGDEARMDKIGRYEIENELGRGGMATVYKACDPLFEREVAVKILPQAMLHDPKFRTRFEREGKMIARLEHNAIVPVYDFGEQDGQPYIVMRLMTGGDLTGRIRSGALTRGEVGQILSRLASGLDVAHTNGVIHRDLKPGNILFDGYGDAYLSDFGIARMINSSATLTGSGIIGTPAYMSPEQIQGEKDIDGRSDIYSLGVILYQMLSGEMPFEGDTPGKVMLKHVLDPVPDISLKNPDISPAVSTVLTKAMAKEPGERYQSAREMASAYDAAARSEPGLPAAQSILQDQQATLDRAIFANQATSVSKATANAPTAVQRDTAGKTTVSQPAAGEATVNDPPAVEPDSAPLATTAGAAPSIPASANAEQETSTPLDLAVGRKAGAWKWALPIAALIIVVALVGFFVFSRGSSTLASSLTGAVNTPTESAPIETQAAVLAGAPASTEAPRSSPTVTPTETALPTDTPLPASPTPSEAATLAASGSASTPEIASQIAGAPSPAEVEAFLGSAKLLVFEDIVSEYELPYVKESLDAMGLTYKWDGNAQGRILADLASGPEEGGAWDLAIIAMETRANSSSEVLPYINAILEQGTSVILETWNLDQAANEAAKELFATCGVSVKEYFPHQGSALELIVYPILSAASHPILSQPNTRLQFTNPDTRHLASKDLGDLISLTGNGDAQLLIGLDATQAAEQGVLTSCLDGRLTLMSFSSHSFPYDTMAPLWENMIYNALKARMNYLN